MTSVGKYYRPSHTRRCINYSFLRKFVRFSKIAPISDRFSLWRLSRKKTDYEAFARYFIARRRSIMNRLPVRDSPFVEKKLDLASTECVLSLIIKCANFAALKHAKQRRKDVEETPYINHPLGVANILVEEGNVYDPVVIAAALLHDTVEDTDTTIEEIEREFGKNVSDVVAEVTDDKELPKAERKRLQIVHTPVISREAKLVKLSDKIYNLRDLLRSTPVGWTSERVAEYFEWSKAVINGCRGTNAELESIVDSIFEQNEKNIPATVPRGTK